MKRMRGLGMYDLVFTCPHCEADLLLKIRC
jgi:hypothetical protein